MIKYCSFRMIILSIITVSLIACSGNGNHSRDTERKDGYTATLKTKEDSLFNDVMEGHNAAMAKMGKLTGYRKKVQQTLDSLNNSPKNDQTGYIAMLRALAEALKNADDGMNTWMDEFSVDSADNNKGLRLAYLESEKQKVNKIKEDVLSIVQKADSLFLAK